MQVGIVSRLGRYEILRHLATGGMAEVYLARTSGPQGFARHVVVKRIRAEYVRDPRFVRMFLDEARLAATLHHHHVVQVYDVGQEDGEYFFAMEYVHGEDLRRILGASSKRKERVRLEYALAIIQAAAAGLDYAHNQCDSDGSPLGIVHRDVSPSNILVGYDGSVKVVDFGIAKATTRPGETQIGTLKGKIAYLSPEQIRGTGVDRRSDVFSLGVVLYELSTTRRLFRGASQFDSMHRIMSGEVPRPGDVVPDYPPQLERIVLRALALDPANRHQSAGELVADLDGFAHRTRLGMSSNMLGRWITELFGKRPEPWTVSPRAAPVARDDAWTVLDADVADAAQSAAVPDAAHSAGDAVAPRPPPTPMSPATASPAPASASPASASPASASPASASPASASPASASPASASSASASPASAPRASAGLLSMSRPSAIAIEVPPAAQLVQPSDASSPLDDAAPLVLTEDDPPPRSRARHPSMAGDAAGAGDAGSAAGTAPARLRPRVRRSTNLPVIIALVVTGLAMVGGALFLQHRAPRAPAPVGAPP